MKLFYAFALVVALCQGVKVDSASDFASGDLDSGSGSDLEMELQKFLNDLAGSKGSSDVSDLVSSLWAGSATKETFGLTELIMVAEPFVAGLRLVASMLGSNSDDFDELQTKADEIDAILAKIDKTTPTSKSPLLQDLLQKVTEAKRLVGNEASAASGSKDTKAVEKFTKETKGNPLMASGSIASASGSAEEGEEDSVTQENGDSVTQANGDSEIQSSTAQKTGEKTTSKKSKLRLGDDNSDSDSGSDGFDALIEELLRASSDSASDSNE